MSILLTDKPTIFFLCISRWITSFWEVSNFLRILKVILHICTLFTYAFYMYVLYKFFTKWFSFFLSYNFWTLSFFVTLRKFSILWIFLTRGWKIFKTWKYSVTFFSKLFCCLFFRLIISYTSNFFDTWKFIRLHNIGFSVTLYFQYNLSCIQKIIWCNFFQNL